MIIYAFLFLKSEIVVRICYSIRVRPCVNSMCDKTLRISHCLSSTDRLISYPLNNLLCPKFITLSTNSMLYFLIIFNNSTFQHILFVRVSYCMFNATNLYIQDSFNILKVFLWRNWRNWPVGLARRISNVLYILYIWIYFSKDILLLL